MLHRNEDAQPSIAVEELGETPDGTHSTTEINRTISQGKTQKYGPNNWRQQTHSDYSQWHRTLGSGCFAYDCDLVEFRRKRSCATGQYIGPLEPVVLTERTAVSHKSQLTERYIRDFILPRVGSQLFALNYFALKAGVECRLIVCMKDLSRFAIYDPRTDTIEFQTQDEHAAWLISLEVPCE